MSLLFPIFDYIAENTWAQIVTGVIFFVIIWRINNWMVARAANRRLRRRVEKEERRQTELALDYIDEVEHEYETIADAALDRARTAEPLPSQLMSDDAFRETFGYDRAPGGGGGGGH